jgi:hypothetical protein
MEYKQIIEFICESFNNFQHRDVTTILIGLNNFKNLLHFVMKKKKSFVGHLYRVKTGTTF